MSNLILTHSSSLSSGDNLSGLITTNISIFVEITGLIPDNWFNYGSVHILIDDENIPNKLPVIHYQSIHKHGLVYIPNHIYNYRVKLYPKPWLLNLNPIPLFEVYVL